MTNKEVPRWYQALPHWILCRFSQCTRTNLSLRATECRQSRPRWSIRVFSLDFACFLQFSETLFWKNAKACASSHSWRFRNQRGYNSRIRSDYLGWMGTSWIQHPEVSLLGTPSEIHKRYFDCKAHSSTLTDHSSQFASRSDAKNQLFWVNFRKDLGPNWRTKATFRRQDFAPPKQLPEFQFFSPNFRFEVTRTREKIPVRTKTFAGDGSQFLAFVRLHCHSDPSRSSPKQRSDVGSSPTRIYESRRPRNLGFPFSDVQETFSAEKLPRDGQLVKYSHPKWIDFVKRAAAKMRHQRILSYGVQGLEIILRTRWFAGGTGPMGNTSL